MDVFFIIALSPAALPYEIALVLLVAGIVFAACKQMRWIWNVLLVCDFVAVVLSVAMRLHFGRFSGLTYFGETVCAVFGSYLFAALTGITLLIRFANMKR